MTTFAAKYPKSHERTPLTAEVGLAILDVLEEEVLLRNYHLLPSARGELLQRLGRSEEAREQFERAASLTQNVRERSILLGRASSCH